LGIRVVNKRIFKIVAHFLFFIVVSTLLLEAMSYQISWTVLGQSMEPHDANAMWVESSAINIANAVGLGFKFNVTVWLNITSTNVGFCQIALRFNSTQLQCVRAGYTGGTMSQFMSGHTTITASPVINNVTGGVLAYEGCNGADYVPAPHVGSLIWIEFQVATLASPGRTLTSKLDISSEYSNNTWVWDPDLNTISITAYDSNYSITYATADKMSVSPSIVFPTDDETIGTRFNVTISLDVAENVFAYQVTMHYNRTELMCVDANVTGYTTSRFMAGHVTNSTVSIDGPPYGNGSVLVAETCEANDSVQGPKSGTLFWIEFQILQTPGTNQTLNSTFDISTEQDLNNTFVLDQSSNYLAFTSYDGLYEFVGPIVVSTPAGTNVAVAPTQNVNITFANVTAEGFTTLSSAQPATTQFVSVVCDQITTNATYTGNITLQFVYNPGLSLQDQQAMKIWLWNDSSNCWVDVTTSVNTSSNVVYGVSPHLSMFGVTSNLGITGDLDMQGTTTVNIPSAPPAPPQSLAALNYYQINTTKSLPAPISLSLGYNYGNIPLEEEIFNQMWMWNESSASWVDITTGVNTTSHMVYGSAPHLSMFGVTSLPQPPGGVTVASANCPKTVVCQGYGANINVTIRNQGGSPQTNFNVSLYCNTTLLPATYQIVELDPGAQETLNFTWNTDAGWAIGNYSISAFSQRIGWIYVARLGDINTDNKVDGRDLIIASRAFGTYGPDYFYPGSPATVGWNANADVTNDNKVDGRDLIIMSRHFGEGT
jgi:hypothetical protein